MKTINTTLKAAVAALFASVPVSVQAGFAKSAVPAGGFMQV